MSDNIAGQPDSALVPHTVADQRLYLAVRKHCRVSGGEFPFAVEEVAALYIQPRTGIDMLVPGYDSALIEKVPPEVVGSYGESPVFEDKVCIIRPDIPCLVAGDNGAFPALHPLCPVIECIAQSEHQLGGLLVFKIPFNVFAFAVQPSERVELHPPCVGEPSGCHFRGIPVPAFPEGDGCLGCKGE